MSDTCLNKDCIRYEYAESDLELVMRASPICAMCVHGRKLECYEEKEEEEE